jgi:hypothetical protein
MLLQAHMKRLRITLVIALAATSLGAETPVSTADELVESYTAAAREQSARFRGVSMDVDIAASLPNLHKNGRMHALKRISRLGRITYEALKFDGDNSVKRDVIARYLTAESQARATESSLAVLPANYKFKYKGLRDHGQGLVHVFEVTPRKKIVGLFKGELWLDAQSFLPVRESGRMVKSPSIFLKRVEFVQEYEIRDGLSIPLRMHTTVDTRLIGKAELTVDFRNVALADDAVISAAADETE